MLLACLVGCLLVCAAACGQSAEPVRDPAKAAGAAGTGGPAAGGGSPTAPVTVIRVTVAGGKVSPRPHRVKVARGTAVEIIVTGDAADEFHLHGYDLSMRLAQGGPATMRLTADRAGVFEAELHGAQTRLFELQVG